MRNARRVGDVVVFRLALLPFLIVILLFSCKHDDKQLAFQTFQPIDRVVAQADLLIDLGKVSEAMAKVDSMRRAINDPTVADQFKYYKFYSSYYYHNLSRYDLAKVYTDSMMMVISEHNASGDYDIQLAECNYSLGDILFRLKKYDAAYESFYKAKRLAEKSGNPCNLSNYSYRLGMILFQQARFRSAAHYFIRSYEDSKGCTDDFSSFYRQQELLNNIALSYTRQGVTDSALHYYQAALDFINGNTNRFPERALFYEIARGVIYGNQGQIYAMKGQHLQAESLFKKSIAINAPAGRDNRDARLVRLHLAALYLQEHRLDEMSEQMRYIRTSLDRLPDADAELRYRDLSWRFDQLTGDHRSAFNHLREYNLLNDSIGQSSRGLTEADVSEQLDNLEKRYEINFLKKDKEISDVYFNIVVVLAVMSVAIIFLVVNNWRRSRVNVLALTRLNAQVSEQKATLENTLEQLQLQGREKDRILRAVAHDLRNPIGGVASVSGLLLEEGGWTADQEEMIRLIQNTCLDALQLINEILEITLGEKTAELPKDDVDIHSVVANTVELLRFKAAEKHQQIHFDSARVSGAVRMNREKISRVISNLISNAIKFSPVGASTKISMTRNGRRVRIAVKDKGIGIPDEIKDLVFDTFTEAKRMGTSGEKPFGLGLSISRQIIEAYGGQIWFESENGKGTTFFIELDVEEK